MPTETDDRFPAIAAWIQQGWIEIGNQERTGFSVMALDCGGIVYEDKNCSSLIECLESLERGLREQGDENT